MSTNATKETMLSWDFEQFRVYLPYEVLVAAASVLIQYEGEIDDAANPRIQAMEKQFSIRTNKATWIPERSGSEEINWNPEGSVFRNKRRIFTSMFILELKPPGQNPTIRLLDFGRKLACGKISKQEFYDFIITRYRYPHPAYADSYRLWSASGLVFYPFAALLEILLLLYERDPSHAYLTSTEVGCFLYPNPDHALIPEIAQKIVDARQGGESIKSGLDKSAGRHVSDIMSYLCMTGYAFMESGTRVITIRLNTIGVHPEEGVYFEGSRDQANRVDEIRKAIRGADIGGDSGAE